MSIAQRLAAARYTEIEVGGGWWKLQRPSAADVARQGVATLGVMPQEATAAAASQDSDQALPVAGVQALLRKVSPEGVARICQEQDGIVCAAVVAAADPAPGGGPGPWEQLRLVLAGRKDNPAKGVLSITALPHPVRLRLYEAAMALASDGGQAEETAASFRDPA